MNEHTRIKAGDPVVGIVRRVATMFVCALADPAWTPRNKGYWRAMIEPFAGAPSARHLSNDQQRR